MKRLITRDDLFLQGVPLIEAPGRLTVPAASAFGCALEFVA